MPKKKRKPKVIRNKQILVFLKNRKAKKRSIISRKFPEGTTLEDILRNLFSCPPKTLKKKSLQGILKKATQGLLCSEENCLTISIGEKLDERTMFKKNGKATLTIIC